MTKGRNLLFRLQNSNSPLRSYRLKPPVFISMAQSPQLPWNTASIPKEQRGLAILPWPC